MGILLCRGIPLGNKKEQTIDRQHNLEESLGSYAKVKMPIPKGRIPKDSIFMWHFWSDKILEMEDILVDAA